MQYSKLFSQKAPCFSLRGQASLWLAVIFTLIIAWLPAQAQPFAYVTNNTDHTVSVIDAASNTVVATVPVSDFPTGIAVTPDGSFAYVTGNGYSDVSVIETASNTVVATIPVGSVPFGLAFTPDGAFAYVSSASSVSGSVSIINTASNTVVGSAPAGTGPIDVDITPDGAFAYVTNYWSHNVSVIATATNTVVATVPLSGSYQRNSAITPDGAYLYVLDGVLTSFPFVSSQVEVISTASNTVVDNVSLGNVTLFSFGHDVAITPDGAFVYVTNFDFNSSTSQVSVIATASNTVVATVPVGDFPFGVAITPDGSFAYVANNASNDVSVIDISSNTVVATVSVGSGPFDIAFGPASSVEDLINNLIADIQAMGLQGGLENALISKLENTLKSYQKGNYTAATNQLDAFSQQCDAQRGKKLTNAQADELIAAAQAIIDQINSSTMPALPKSGLPREQELAGLPNTYTLEQNYPNPFNPTTTIRFSLPEAGSASLRIYNSAGQLVKTLASGTMEAGAHNLVWDATNESGVKVASGIYLYQLWVSTPTGQAGSFSQVRKMILMK